jgi:hypothetical protein
MKTQELSYKQVSLQIKHEPGENRMTLDHAGTEDNAPLLMPEEEAHQAVKRALEDVADDDQPRKAAKVAESSPTSSPQATRTTRSATSNKKATPKRPVAKEKGAQKITSFFSK